MKSITLPKSMISEEIESSICAETSIVVIGANGSGKTRIGTWLENNNDARRVLRISAQKSLSMPETVSTTSIEQAKASLYFGYYNQNFDYSVQYKHGQRWGSNPDTYLLSDYDKLLTYLFSDNYEESLKYIDKVNKTSERISPPKTKLNKAIDIWECVITHRKLMLTSGTLKTKPIGDTSQIEYKALNMSDGERAIFYLIGQCLSAPENGIIIIDEPEVHLHKSILRKLWDKIEKEREDCLFIYLTHDLEFASTRVGTIKICLKEFDGTNFYWYPVNDEEAISEEVYLEILGSRNAVLFIEGDGRSYDRELYSLIYTDYTIKSLGSCKKVIEATKSFNSLKKVHNLDCYGIIDRDYKMQEYIDSLKSDNVYCPLVAEVENLFLIEEVLLAVANQFCIPQPHEKVYEIKEWVIEQFNIFKEKYALEATSSYVDYCLNSFNGNASDIASLKSNFNHFANQIDIEQFYNDRLSYAEKLIREKNYNDVIKVFNNKGLISQIGKFFDIKPSSYTKKVKDIINSGNNVIVEAMKKYLPQI